MSEFLNTIFASPYGAFTALLFVFVVGEVVTKLTKGFVPLAFTSTVLLLVLFWTGIFPADLGDGVKLVDAAGISSTIFSLASALLITNLGTLINRKEMAAQWRTVVIALFGLTAICVITLTIGAKLYSWNDAVAATPVLAGAAMAVTIVKQATAALDLHLYLVAVVVMAVQGIFGYPMVSFCLRKEAKKLVNDYREGKLVVAAPQAAAAEKKAAKKESANMIMLKLGFVSVLAFITEWLTDKAGFKVSVYVWAMLYGFIAHELGFLSDDCLRTANCYGLCQIIILLYLFGALAGYSAAVVIPTFAEAAVFIILSAAGMALVSWGASKLFKKSFWICWAIALNAYLGFPINVMITQEVCENCAAEGEERAAVSAELMPQMLVASFVCVTIVSVVIAGFMVTRFIF